MRRFIPTQSGLSQATVDFGKIYWKEMPILVPALMTWKRKSENQLSFWAHGTELRHSYCRFLPTKSAPV